MESGHSDTTTRGIRIRVAAQHMPGRSDPARSLYAFAYRVVMTNEGTATAKLLSRHWIIRDARNETREVQGPGVVGAFPELGPGESFEYMSSSALHTEWGTMEGSYRFQRENGDLFDVAIGRFFLAKNVAPLNTLTDDGEAFGSSESIVDALR